MILSERYGMPLPMLLRVMTSADIAECMAFDNLKDEKYMDKLKSEMMTDDEQTEKLKALLGYKNGNNSKFTG